MRLIVKMEKTEPQVKFNMSEWSQWAHSGSSITLSSLILVVRQDS